MNSTFLPLRLHFTSNFRSQLSSARLYKSLTRICLKSGHSHWISAEGNKTSHSSYGVFWGKPARWEDSWPGESSHARADLLTGFKNKTKRDGEPPRHVHQMVSRLPVSSAGFSGVTTGLPFPIASMEKKQLPPYNAAPELSTLQGCGPRCKRGRMSREPRLGVCVCTDVPAPGTFLHHLLLEEHNRLESASPTSHVDTRVKFIIVFAVLFRVTEMWTLELCQQRMLLDLQGN